MNTSPAFPTDAQRDIWFAHVAATDPAEYQCAELLEFTQPPDCDVLERTIRSCLQSLDFFNADYRLAEAGQDEHAGADSRSRLVAIPHDNPIAIERIRLAEKAEVLPFARRFAAHVAAGPLRGEALTGHCLIEVGEGEQRVVFWVARFHHILGDGFAFNSLIGWIGKCYTAACAGEEAPPAPFDSYSHPTPLSNDDLAFWRDHAPVETASLGQSQKATGAVVYSASVTMPGPAQTLIAGLGKQGVSPLAVYTAVGARLMQVEQGSEAVTVGIPVMGRPLGQRHLVVGPQVTVLPITVTPAPGESLFAQLSNVEEQLVAARSHSQVTTAALRREFGLSGREALMTSAHVNFRPFTPKFRFGDAHVLLTTLRVGPLENAELIFQLLPDGAVQMTVMATSELVAQRYAARLEHAFTQLPAVDRLDEIIWCAPAEAEAIAAAHERLPAVTPAGLGLRALVQRTRAAGAPATAAGLLCDAAGTWWSVDQVWKRVYGITADLRERGVSGGATVAIQLSRGVDFMCAVAAVIELDATWVPIDPDLPAARRADMRTAANADAVIEAGAAGGVVVTAREAAAPEERTLEVGESRCAYILFTSGSTGKPKPVMVSEAGLINRLEWMVELLGLSDTDRLLWKTPSSFDVSVWEYVLALTHGIPTVILGPQAHRDPVAVAGAIAEENVTVCHFVPTALKTFLATAPDTPSLRAIVTSGEALEVAEAQGARTMLGVEVWNFYGPAEAAIDVTACRVNGEETRIPIGVPVANTQISVRDRWGNPVGINTPGELVIHGVQVGLGYRGMAEATAAAFSIDADGRRSYRTGDVACWAEAQTAAAGVELFYLGRRDSQAKLNGQRLELGEVEVAAAASAAVGQAAAVVATVGAHQVLVAAVTPAASGEAVDPEGLKAEMARRLPAYMVPGRIVVVEALPMTVNGKLDRRAIAELADAATQAGAAAADGSDGAAGGSEAGAGAGSAKAVLEAFAAALHRPVDSIGLDDNFFALGGTSLSAVELTQRLPGITVADVFAHPTVRALVQRQAEALLGGLAATADSGAGGFAELLELRPARGGSTVVCLYPAGGLSWCYATLAAWLPDPRQGIIAVQCGLDTPKFGTLAETAAHIAQRLVAAGHTDVHLVGWSVGGVLAHHLAAHPGGMTVRGVYLLDAYPEDVWAQLPDPTEAEQREALLTMAGVPASQYTDADLMSLEAVRRVLHATPNALSVLPREQMYGVIEVVRHNSGLLRRGEPAYVDGEVHHFTADRDVPSRSELLTAASWEPWTRKLVEHHCDVTHPGMVSSVVLRTVAEMIAAAPA